MKVKHKDSELERTDASQSTEKGRRRLTKHCLLWQQACCWRPLKNSSFFFFFFFLQRTQEGVTRKWKFHVGLKCVFNKCDNEGMHDTEEAV